MVINIALINEPTHLAIHFQDCIFINHSMNTPQDFNKFTDIFVRILFLWKNIFYIKFGYWLTFILNVKSLESF